MTWRTPALAALAGLLAGAAAGWRLHPDPPPSIDLAVALRAASSWRERASSRREEGPVRVVERWRTLSASAPPAAPGCAPCPSCEEHERVEERGPVTTVTHREAAGTAQTTSETRLVQVPAPPMPRWTASWHPMVLPSTGLGQFGAGIRVAGPFWAEAWVAPSTPAAGVGLRLEW